MPHDNDLVSAAEHARQLQAIAFQHERTEARILEIVKEAVAIEARVRALETSNQNRAIVEAREDERDKAMQERLARLEDGIQAIRGSGSKVIWTIASAVILAVVAFVLKGGLN